MNFQLYAYIPMIDFLAQILGDNTEVVLHEVSYDNKGHEVSIVYINNSISGRKLGGPGTDLLLKIIKTEEYKEKNYLVNYTSQAMDGRLLNSSSFFIKDEEKNLIGVICVNTDRSNLKELQKCLELSLTSLQKFIATELFNNPDEEPVDENLYLSAENSIEQAVFETIGTTNLVNLKLTKKEKVRIVTRLYDQGFFELKGSISKIANIFNMSEVSIYKYLQEVKNTGS